MFPMSGKTDQAANPVVDLRIEDGVAVIAIDNPPVNALSHGVRRGLLEALDKAETDDRVSALVIHGQGRVFIAGADIREFGRPPAAPSLA